MKLFRTAMLLLIGLQLVFPGARLEIGALGQAAVDPIDQIHLAWTADSATSLTVTWHAADPAAPAYLEYRPLGASSWQTANASQRPAGTIGPLYQADLSGLLPDTTYEYQIPGTGGFWTGVYTATTAPPSGSGGFEVVYVADTGITGRTDGLASGTTRVLQTIAAQQPDLILGGGDYVAFNTDNRFANLDAAIDAWFNQIQPLAAYAPLMPAYGNHEYLDSNGYDQWAARFPTPPGFDGQRFYSFDVGNAHFISIYAPVGTIPTAAMQWIEADIQAAQAAGKTWIIPFLHVSPFSDGGNHSSGFTLRNELGPLFETYGIRLVLSAHDQAYERTLPLVDVPNSNSPTTNRLSCYQPGDGTIWLKASPGGKLSNVNWDFSEFQTWPAPAYTALRTNEMFAFVQLQFNPDQSLTVNGYGVPERGGGPHLVETFDLIGGSCGPELAFSPNVLEARLDAGAAPLQATLDLGTSNGSQPQPVSVQSDAGWLSGSCSPAGVCSLELDPAGLSPGTYAGWLTASASGYRPGRALVVLVVQGDTAHYSLQFSSSPDRSNPQALHGQTLTGISYIFTTPDDPGIGQVRFFLDQVATQRETFPPFDLAGTGAGNLAEPFYTTLLSNGTHHLRAVVVNQDGSTELASATFLVDNPPPVAPVSLQLGGPLAGQTGQTYAFTASVEPISTTLPVTYNWVVTDQGAITHTNGLSDTVQFFWNSPGSKLIELTATNPGGSLQVSHTIVLTGTVVDYQIYLPSVHGP